MSCGMSMDGQSDTSAVEPVALGVGSVECIPAQLIAQLETSGLKWMHVSSAAEAVERLCEVNPSVVVVNDHVQDVPLMTLVRQMLAILPDLPIVALGNLDDRQAAEVRRAGAREVLDCAAGQDRLHDNVVKWLAPERGSTRGPGSVSDTDRVRFVRIYGSLFRRGPRTRELEQAAVHAAETDTPVLLMGEPGTGKKTVARAIHHLSRSSGRCLVVSCSGVSSESLPAELFEAAGQARGGTLVLDEVGDVPVELQGELLAGDARVVATTSRHLPAVPGAGRLPREIDQRFGALAIGLPPLRERAEDVPGLADFFRDEFTQQCQRAAPALSVSTLAALTQYSWPGNVLELQNLVHRYVALGGEQHLLSELASRSRLMRMRRPGRGTGGAERNLRAIGRHAAHEAEMAAILATLEQVQWNRAEAARLLGVSYKTLLNKLNRAGVPGRIKTPLDPDATAS